MTEEQKAHLRRHRQKQVFPKKDNKFERRFQNALKEKGVEFETHKAITGQPDIFIRPYHCIFLDGCYFHAHEHWFVDNGHDESTMRILGKTPKEKRDYDANVTKRLIDMGYDVTRFWECEVERDFDGCVGKVLKIISETQHLANLPNHQNLTNLASHTNHPNPKNTDGAMDGHAN